MKVAIFGSGGLAKELIGYLLDDGGYEIECVVSTEPFNNPAFRYPVVARPPQISGLKYLLAVSDPALKRQFAGANEDRWVSYAHKSAFVSPHARIGKGCILTPQSVVAGDATLGDFVFFNTNATVGHDSTIGSYSTLMPNSEVCGDCDVGEGVFIGIGAYVLAGKKVGDRAKVSAGAVVRHDIPAGATVYGDPAKPR